MLNKKIKSILIKICRNHCYPKDKSVVVPEPYIPYIPKNWNGILVLGERQYIKNGDIYNNWLEQHKEEPEILITRLEQNPYGDNRIGISQWDDKTIKLSLQAIFEGANLNFNIEDVAVSNAIPWTKINNEEPDKEMLAEAINFWAVIIEAWKSEIKAIILLGDKAEKIMEKAEILKKYDGKWLKLNPLSRRAINLLSGIFDCDDLLKRFPEVQKALKIIAIDKEQKKQYESKIFCACHAVSLGVERFKDCFSSAPQ